MTESASLSVSCPTIEISCSLWLGGDSVVGLTVMNPSSAHWLVCDPLLVAKLDDGIASKATSAAPGIRTKNLLFFMVDSPSCSGLCSNGAKTLPACGQPAFRNIVNHASWSVDHRLSLPSYQAVTLSSVLDRSVMQ